VLGVIATAPFYGDAIITPAISVLSAVEGLTRVHPGFASLVLPIAVGLLIGAARSGLDADRGAHSINQRLGPADRRHLGVPCLEHRGHPALAASQSQAQPHPARTGSCC
jgi:hypothetical protein